MIKGKIERRTAQRIPFETDLQIKLINSDGNILLAQSINLSAGGLKFSTSGIALLELGEKLEFSFDLPCFGEKKVEGEICYREIEYDQNQQIKNTNYGVKFIAIPLETWNYILDYCYQNNANPEPDSAKINADSKQLITTQNQETKQLNTSIKASIIYHGQEIEGIIEDLSFGGVRVCTSSQIPVNSKVNIAIQYREKTFFLNGICVWNSSATNDNTDPKYSFVAGIFFNSLQKNQFDDLSDLINSLLT